MAIESTVYGLSSTEEKAEVFRIETEHDGTVWVSKLGEFYDTETAHAFCRAWNGEPGPK